jgi:Tfp pilus assembly protein PilF
MSSKPTTILLSLGLACLVVGCAEPRGLFGIAGLRHESDDKQAADPPAHKPTAAGLGGADTKQAEKPEDKTLEGQLALARLCERRGETGQAEQMYQALVKKVPRDPRPHHRLAVLAVEKREFASAEEHFHAAQSLGPPTAELLTDLGYCYYIQHQLEKAESTLQDALKLDPRSVAATNNLGLVVGAQGRFDEALKLFKRVNPEAQACANMAFVLAENGKLNESEQMYLRALTLDNKMRAAAQAMLQVAQRRRAEANSATAIAVEQPKNTAVQPTSATAEIE